MNRLYLFKTESCDYHSWHSILDIGMQTK